ncbi:hypothetical protein HPB51_011383 [Rhipicephalus microplus]|uniref:PiggyBac transposable element-derived protein domain-containing protein n=1 Tax=Rhipicephalus microplus TaxID=6941 RepID=A0A9J6F1N7_RHIMP|nr:hypothetical protein HPB51_000757 [Rhipicephalus microplus]KAH8040555.1 hypothetical protein HPB51_011383 [Rhipicephalus microplus]
MRAGGLDFRPRLVRCPCGDVIVPPDPTADTDEEEEDDNGMTDVVVNDVSGRLELHCDGGDDDPDDATARKKRAKVPPPCWRNSDPEYTWSASTNRPEEKQSKLTSQFFGKSPNEVFSSMLDEEILTHIVMQTGNYAKQNNEHRFVFGIEDLKKFIRILLLSGYHKLPSQRMYWSLDEDTGVLLVASCISRQRFLDI